MSKMNTFGLITSFLVLIVPLSGIGEAETQARPTSRRATASKNRILKYLASLTISLTLLHDRVRASKNK